MILIDTPCNGWSHMVGSSIKELHDFAARMGLKRCWFSNKRGKNQPHCDVKAVFYDKAVELGAIRVLRKDLFLFLKENYKL